MLNIAHELSVHAHTPRRVAAELNLDSSGWQIDIIMLCDGKQGSVWQAALNLDAVIRPDLILYYKQEQD